MANLEAATKSLKINAFLNTFDEELKHFLLKAGFDKPLFVFHVFEKGPTDPDLRMELEGFAKAAVAKNATEAGAWAEQVEQLYVLACEVAPGALKRITKVDSFELSADLLQLEHEGRQATEEKDLRVLHARSLAQLPSEWRGKRNRRISEPASETARQDAETKERLKCAKEPGRPSHRSAAALRSLRRHTRC